MQPTEKAKTMTKDFSQILKDSANGWFLRGFNIVPFLVKEKTKTPLVPSWKSWETQKQTREEFEGLDWCAANAYAIVCGRPNEDGLSVYVIDVDVPEFSSSDIPRVTRTERTRHGGT